MLKKFLMRVGVLLVVFIIAVFAFGKIINKDMPDTSEEMSQATLPLVYMMNGETQINCLHGYTKVMEVTALRDALTPLDGSRSLQIQIQPYQKKIENISFQVMTSDGQTTMENTKVTKISQQDGLVTAELELQNKILINTEYMLQIAVTIGGKEVYYYTRILQEDGLNVDSYLTFVQDFYRNCLEGNDLNIVECVEPADDADTSTFAHIDIHSSTDQMIWKGLSPKLVYDPIPDICEINENTCTMVLDYVISTESDEGETDLYQVSEYYRMRYTDSRVLLLDFERNTNQIFNPENSVLTEKGIRLGIQNGAINCKTDQKGNFYAFVIQGALWSYNISDNKMVQIFSFPQKNNSDARDMYQKNAIQVISIDEQGNMYFLVCGYMNRGNHEGESGIAVYSYDAAGSLVNECLFVDTKETYSLLKQDMKSLAYVTEDRSQFYLMLDGEVYGVNIQTREVENIISGVKKGCFASSASGKQIAWVKENDLCNSRTIEMINLETGERREITCGKKERLRILGFIEEDIAYGVAAAKNIDSSNEGNEIFPMNRVLIINEQGETVKDYQPDGCFVSGAEIEGKLMTLTRIRKKGKKYEDALEDRIVNSQESEETSTGIAAEKDAQKRAVRILKTLSTPNFAKQPQIVRSREVIYEGSKKIILEPKEKKEALYYVYAKGELEGSYYSPALAIQKADEALGVVVDSSQQIVWERGNKQTKLDLNVDTFPAAFRKYHMDVNAIQSEMKQTVLDLTGCTLDQVLYFVSQGVPVLAQTPDGAVIIGGYDEYNTRLLQQGENELIYYGMQDSTDMFEEAGNEFITYLNPLTE